MYKTRSKAVFIDVDNTLLDFDSYVKETMEAGFRQFCIGEYEPYMYDVFKRENDRLWRQIELGELVFEELKKTRWNNIFNALGMEADGPAFETYFRAALNESAILMPGAMEMLKELSEEYVLCAASNGPYEQQLHRLCLAGMSGYFDHMFISEQLGVSKPSKLFYEKAFEQLNAGREQDDQIAPSDAVMLGDSLTSDMAGGRGFGMKTCYYSRGTQPDAAKLLDVDAVIMELSEAPRCIARLLH